MVLNMRVNALHACAAGNVVYVCVAALQLCFHAECLQLDLSCLYTGIWSDLSQLSSRCCVLDSAVIAVYVST